MRLIIVTSLILTCLTAVAIANPVPSGTIGLFGDAAGTVDLIYTDGVETVTVYVVLHVNAPEFPGGFWFSAVSPACFNATHVGDSSLYPDIGGNSQTAVYVLTPTFEYGTHTLMAITFTVEGDTPECCWYGLQVDPASELSWTAGGLWINPNEPMNCVSPVESSTWGAIKALYR